MAQIAFIAYTTLALDVALTVCHQFLEALHDKTSCCWLEDETRIDGLCIRDDVSINELDVLITHWPQGRLFTPEADLRWEHQVNEETPEEPVQVYLVLIADQPLAANLMHSEAMELVEEMSYLLWGEYRAGVWQEGRIPKLATYYPSEWNGPHAVLLAQSYEIDWPAAQTVRTVTRYLRYDGNHTVPMDARFQRNLNEE